jgi:hypothetical protein
MCHFRSQKTDPGPVVYRWAFPPFAFWVAGAGLASEQRLAAVRLEFVELEDDPLKGKEKETSRAKAGGFP